MLRIKVESPFINPFLGSNNLSKFLCISVAAEIISGFDLGLYITLYKSFWILYNVLKFNSFGSFTELIVLFIDFNVSWILTNSEGVVL